MHNIRPAVVRKLSIQADDFDLTAEIAALQDSDAGIGAVVSFVGTVRDRDSAKASKLTNDGQITCLELEHYPGGTERAIDAMIDQAVSRFGIRGATVIHRVGKLSAGEQIVLVAVTSTHRHESFQACEFLMDYLKTQAPFWKREYTVAGDGSTQSAWVDARDSDDAALARWGIAASNAVPVAAAVSSWVSQ